MAFNSLGQYVANHKSWDHVGNMIPVVEYSEGTRPHGEFKPAAWLPVQFYDKYYENWMVVMPGKILAFDNDGRLVPAQYGLASASITYTANDVDAGVIDVRTGETLLIGNIGSFDVADVDGVTIHFMGRSGVAMAVSDPVGVAPYAYIQWAGDGGANDDGFTPAAYRQHNYNMQHKVALLCDYVLELPLVPATTASANLTQDSFADNVATLTALANLPVAVNTARTPLTFADGTLTDSDTRFLNQVDAVTDIVASGDWHIDYTTGVISVYASATLGAGNIYTLTYSHYASAPTGSNVSKFACALGDLKAGNFVKCNADSNFVVATTEDFKDIMGQVLEVVRTAYNSLGTDASGSLPAYAGQMDQMPGTATGGVTDKVHYAGAANLVVRVNLVSR
jgi:hypothetical protein